jgi:hypothetical protein
VCECDKAHFKYLFIFVSLKFKNYYRKLILNSKKKERIKMDFLSESRKAGLFVNEFNVLEELYAKK